MKFNLDRFRARAPMVRFPRGFIKVMRFLKRVFSLVAITLSIICVLLSVSELFVFWIDTSAGVNNYVDWTRSLIAPLVLAAVFGAIAILLNLDIIFKGKGKAQPAAPGGKLEIPDLD
jgi:hypothetical protein